MTSATITVKAAPRPVKTEKEPDLLAYLNMESRVGKVIGVVSGKGGVESPW